MELDASIGPFGIAARRADSDGKGTITILSLRVFRKGGTVGVVLGLVGHHLLAGFALGKAEPDSGKPE